MDALFRHVLRSFDGRVWYGWLSIDSYKAGFDFYYNCEKDDFIYEYMSEEMEDKHVILSPYFSLDNAREVKHTWMLRGVLGRSRATWMFAGFTAIALARLARGIIFSDDGGADNKLLPTDPDSFLSWFPMWCYGNWDY